jgi:thaumarchaeosortase
VTPTLMRSLISSLDSLTKKIEGFSRTLMKFLPVIAFIPPFLILYSLYPASFEATWKGRTFYLFFIWLAFLEVVLNWEKIQGVKVSKAKSVRTLGWALVLLLPTIYVIVATQFGLNTVITSWTGSSVLPDMRGFVSLSTEYLVFTLLFALIIALGFGVGRLKDFGLSTLFLGAIGLIYTIDTFYPGGSFTPFQLPVPITTQLAANVLNLMGYTTTISQVTDRIYGPLPMLTVQDPRVPMSRGVTFGIAWPCAGIESLIIYTVTILVFLRGSSISLKWKAACFSIGGVVTYFINVLRIVTIFTLGLQYGQYSTQVNDFHYYYGQLYSITWIISYPLLIIGSRILWSKLKGRKTEEFAIERISALSQPS